MATTTIETAERRPPKELPEWVYKLRRVLEFLNNPFVLLDAPPREPTQKTATR